ncbi:MAG: cadherin-like domain-containing protein, partial [Methyloglobulus sp.]
DGLTASGLAISSGSGTLVDNGNGTWTYTPALNDNTAVAFSYSVSDGNGGSVAASASLDITPATIGIFNPLLLDDIKKNYYPNNNVTPNHDTLSPRLISSNDYIEPRSNVVFDLGLHVKKILDNLDYSSFDNTISDQNNDADQLANKNRRFKNHSTFQFINKAGIVDSQLNDNSDSLLDERMRKISHDYDFIEHDPKQVDVEIMLGTTAAFTVGFVSWILRGTALLTSLLSTVPLFSRFDPIPILNLSKKSKSLDKKGNKKNDAEADSAGEADE